MQLPTADDNRPPDSHLGCSSDQKIEFRFSKIAVASRSTATAIFVICSGVNLSFLIFFLRPIFHHPPSSLTRQAIVLTVWGWCAWRAASILADNYDPQGGARAPVAQYRGNGVFVRNQILLHTNTLNVCDFTQWRWRVVSSHEKRPGLLL